MFQWLVKDTKMENGILNWYQILQRRAVKDAVCKRLWARLFINTTIMSVNCILSLNLTAKSREGSQVPRQGIGYILIPKSSDLLSSRIIVYII